MKYPYNAINSKKDTRMNIFDMNDVLETIITFCRFPNKHRFIEHCRSQGKLPVYFIKSLLGLHIFKILTCTKERFFNSSRSGFLARAVVGTIMAVCKLKSLPLLRDWKQKKLFPTVFSYIYIYIYIFCIMVNKITIIIPTVSKIFLYRTCAYWRLGWKTRNKNLELFSKKLTAMNTLKRFILVPKGI